MSLTISRAVLDRVQAQVRDEYLREFGLEALSDSVRALSRGEAMRIYARDLRFWRVRLPQDVEALRDIESVAMHVLCTNAEANLTARARQLGVWDAVREELRRSRDQLADQQRPVVAEELPSNEE
jgi:hypothetical protein